MTQVFSCPRCGRMLRYGDLVCGNCGALVYSARLNELAAAAQAAETSDPNAAALLWQQALMLLPADSQQAHDIRQRIAMLSGGAGVPVLEYQPPPSPQHDSWAVATLKTGGSMLLSI